MNSNTRKIQELKIHAKTARPSTGPEPAIAWPSTENKTDPDRNDSLLAKESAGKQVVQYLQDQQVQIARERYAQ